MKKLLGKIPAMLAMLISLFSFFFYVQYLCVAESDIWIISVLIALLSIPLYFVDAIISFVRGLKKDDRTFHYLLALVLVGTFPMLMVFGQNGRDSFNVIWNVYYLVVFVLEVISIKNAISTIKASKKAQEPVQ